MRNNSNISVLQVLSAIGAQGLLAMTVFVLTANAHGQTLRKKSQAPIIVPKADSDSFYYDSAIQRSKFRTTNPRYVEILDDQLEDRRSAFLWKMRFDSQSLQTAQNIQSQNVGATLRGKLKYRLLENLDFKAKANINLESGRSQDIFGDLEPASGIYPRELKVQYKPLEDYLTLGFGQIHQQWFNQPLFIGNLGFPGLQQKIGFSTNRVDVDLITQQLIPTSATLGTRVTEREELPNFFTESIQATWRISSFNFVKGRVTHFRYSKLPAIVAFDSFIFGNTVTNTDERNAEFIYGFDGFMGDLGFEQKFTDSLALQLQYYAIKNNEAPNEAGEAQMIRAVVSNDFGRWIVSGGYEQYFIESDAVPAAYNSHRYGHNNRIGDSFEMSFESKDWDVIFRANYTRANLLQDSAVRVDGLQQDDQETLYIAVETAYDFI